MGNPILGYWWKLHEKMTAPEAALEPHIAALGERYRAQHLFLKLNHIADFALLDRRLIIEVDGASHETPRQQEKDLLHTLALRGLGWEVVRVTNEQALADPEGTVRYALMSAPHQKAVPTQALTDRLDQLRQNHPELLVPRAKRPRSRKPAAPKAASPRRSRATPPPGPT